MRDETKDKAGYIIGMVSKEILSAILWAWIILACIARDPDTALMILVLKSLIWTVVDKEIKRR